MDSQISDSGSTIIVVYALILTNQVGKTKSRGIFGLLRLAEILA